MSSQHHPPPHTHSTPGTPPPGNDSRLARALDPNPPCPQILARLSVKCLPPAPLWKRQEGPEEDGRDPGQPSTPPNPPPQEEPAWACTLATGLKSKRAAWQTLHLWLPALLRWGGGLFLEGRRVGESASFILEVSKASGREQRGLCLPRLLHADPDLHHPLGLWIYLANICSGLPLPGPELPQAWVRLAKGRGPGWGDGREGGTPGQ